MPNIFDFLQDRQRVILYAGEKPIMTLDAALSEEHTLTAQMTRHPIELGAEISDFVINRPRIYKLEGIISDDPVDILQRGIVSRSVGFAVPENLQSKINQNVLTDTGKPSVTAFQQMEYIWENKIPLTIVCDLKKYENMVMESCNIPRSPSTYRAFKFTATFMQGIVSQIEYVVAPKRITAFETNAQPENNLGKQSSESVTTDNRSRLRAISDWASNLFGTGIRGQ